jgi:hypothetical protein
MLFTSIQEARAVTCVEDVQIESVITNYYDNANDPYDWGVRFKGKDNTEGWRESDVHLDWVTGWELFEAALSAFSHHDKVTLYRTGKTSCYNEDGTTRQHFNAIRFSHW